MIRNISIRYKFTAIAVATTAIILILASLAFVALEINNYRRALAQELTAIAQITASNMTAAIVFDDRAAAHETLTALSARPNIESAAIFTPDGRLFARHTPGDTHGDQYQYPQIHTAGELKATNLGDAKHYCCSCRTRIADCRFWRDVTADMREKGIEYSVAKAGTSLRDIPGRYTQRLLRPLHRGEQMELLRDSLLLLSKSWRQAYLNWEKRNYELISSLSRVAGTPFIVDSSKIAIRLKYLNRLSNLDVKVIRVIRDGRAVALTYMDPSIFADAKDPALRGGGTGVSTDRKLTMTEAATEWKRSNEEADAVIATLAENDCLSVTYEALCADTGETLSKIHTFLGLDDYDGHEKFREYEHHVVGNGMRFDNDSKVVLDERWRSVLGTTDLEAFDRVAGSKNKAYGYH